MGLSRRVAGVVLMSGAALVACSNDPPPGADSPPLVSVHTPTPTPTPSETPSATPSQAPVAQTLCSRLDQTAIGRILKVQRVELDQTVTAAIDLPVYDVCTFDVTAPDPKTKRPVVRPVRIGVSVLPATRADLAIARRQYKARNAAVGESGFGTDAFVVFLSNGRLVKVSSGLGGRATYAHYLALAREAAKQTAGLPAAQLEISKPECDKAGSAASKVLGEPAPVRRDRVNAYGDVECAWGTPRRTVSSTATRIKNAEQVFERNARQPGAEPVPLGDDGLYDARTHAVQLRIGADKVATFAALPQGQAAKNDVIAFALRLSGLYTN